MIIAITGLPGTGKTTFADALTYRLEAEHVNADRTRRMIGKLGDYSTQTKKLVYATILNQVEDFVKEGYTVIVDSTFYLKEVRQQLEQIGRTYGQPVIWIQITATEETVRQRLEKIRENSEADFEVYLMVRELYEPMDGDFLRLASDELIVKDMILGAVQYIKAKQMEFLSLVEQ